MPTAPMTPTGLAAALRATGELLEADGAAVAVVVVGGAALALQGIVGRGPGSVHVQDLLALDPDDRELRNAAAWVRGQDAASGFPKLLEEVVAHVRQSRPTD